MPQKFQSIIFDLGGVLYDIDPKLSFKYFEDKGLEKFNSFYNLKEQDSVFDDLETGKIGRKAFAERLNNITGRSFGEKDIYEGWNALLIGIDKSTIELVHKLRETYNIYLLSNTNELHMEAIDKQVQKQYGLNDLSVLFDKAYYSFEMGLRKPDVEIYNYIINDQNLHPSETAFIDDNADNIDGATKAGLVALHKPKEEPLVPYLREWGIID